MADKSVGLSKQAHERLAAYKDRHGHTTFDSAIRELLLRDVPETFRIRFAGEFGEGLEFVEVENAAGESINVGEWREDGDYWLLEVTGDE